MQKERREGLRFNEMFKLFGHGDIRLQSQLLKSHESESERWDLGYPLELHRQTLS